MEQGLEKEIQTAWKATEYQRAATISIQSYGPEILGFLVAFTKDRSQADDVFSYFLEDFWRGLPRFDWRCSLRVWSYTLARHAAKRYAIRSQGRRKGLMPLSQVPELANAAEKVRTSTAHYLRTAVKSRMRELREQLSDKEQILLVLRVDWELAWRDIAVIMSDDSSPLDGESLPRAMSTLRKQFERVKEKLRKLSEEEGLIAY